jgi:hypothetical protein
LAAAILIFRITRGGGSKTGWPSRTVSASILPKCVLCIRATSRRPAGERLDLRVSVVFMLGFPTRCDGS